MARIPTIKPKYLQRAVPAEPLMALINASTLTHSSDSFQNNQNIHICPMYPILKQTNIQSDVVVKKPSKTKTLPGYSFLMPESFTIWKFKKVSKIC